MRLAKSLEATPHKTIYITTTGISEIEKSLLELPDHIVIQDKLTPNTKLLVTYKFLSTPKYIQALKWSIPIVSINYLWEICEHYLVGGKRTDEPGYTRYKLRRLEGALFSTSRVSKSEYSNYFLLLGCHYEPNVSIFIDFLLANENKNDCNKISDNDSKEDRTVINDSKEDRTVINDSSNISEKILFCKRFGIPIIKQVEVFVFNEAKLIKGRRYDAKELNSSTMFANRIFYLDTRLPRRLFNQLRRYIIENEGTRVSSMNDRIDYLLTMKPEEYGDKEEILIHYQYIFDCVESKALLYPGFYKLYIRIDKRILTDIVAVVKSNSGGSNKLNRRNGTGNNKSNNNISSKISYIIACENKLKALGALIKQEIDMRVTHVISYESFINESNLPYIVVRPEWVNNCLHSLRYTNEDRFICGSYISQTKYNKQLVKPSDSKLLFQFTGLSTKQKTEIIGKLDRLSVSYNDSKDFSRCTTHLIMGDLRLSEKFFLALVGGIWVLRPNFIDHFENNSSFDFAKYEWISTDNMSQREKRHISALRKWRISIESTGRRPFYRWRVYLCADKSKYSSYYKLIEFGGGRVTSSDDFTHIFMDKDYSGKLPDTTIKIYSTDNIFSYLLK